MANQKSQHYNWFKGDSSNGKKKSSKDSAKTVWKFTKVFLYFSLFFFSMWGCVQVFIVKTDTSVGRGVEIYSSQNAISPQVASAHLNGKHVNAVTNTKTGTTTPAYDVYSVDLKSDNIWVNSKEDGKTYEDVIKSIKDQTAEKDAYTLDQANKGGNAVARLVVNGKEVADQQQAKGVVYANGKPLTFTTKVATTPSTDNAATILGLNQLVIYEDPSDLTKVTNIDLTKVALPTDVIGNAASVYSLNFAKTILAQKTVDGSKTLLDYIQAVPANVQEAKAHNDFTGTILGISQLAAKDIKAADGSTTKEWHFSGHAFGFSSNKYTPISTWGQAWDMHRGAGPFYGIFVYPIAWVTNKIVDAFPMMHGWESFLAIVIVVVVISMITFLLSFKGTLQQTKMQELNAKKAVIDAKYAPYKGNKQMEMRQRQEVSELYKKEGINPMSSLVTIFVTMPFFFAMWRVIGSIQHIKGTTWLGMNFAATSYKEVFSNFTGSWQYIPLMLLAAGIQVFSQIYPRLLTKRRDKNRINVHQKAAMKKGNKMQNIMLIVFAFMALIFTAGLQVYFIVRSLWRLIEVQATHHILVRQRKMRTKKSAA